VVAGGGQMPLRVLAAAEAAGHPVYALLIEGWADPADFAHVPHDVARMGAVDWGFERLRANAVSHLCLCGRAYRPSLTAIAPGGGMLKLMARIGAAAFQGDDGLLKAMAKVVEEEGFTVVPAQAIVQDALPPAGLLTTRGPDRQAEADIRRAIAVVRALGAVDVGQGAVVQQGLVLGVEAIEGTDALLERCGTLRRDGPGGVLVKLVKPGQDRRLDLPTIGPVTIEHAAAAGLAGIAIEAGGTIVVDRATTIAAAEAAGLFLLAIEPERFTQETPP